MATTAACGNGPGDTIVYVPDTRTAWTGNFVGHAGVAHMLLPGGPEPYADSLRRMREGPARARDDRPRSWLDGRRPGAAWRRPTPRAPTRGPRISTPGLLAAPARYAVPQDLAALIR
ncbi:hypothetical protein ACQEVF_05070 [Nonomuraea polychroma]|uniref:hypothetical protein n=1 Tax=Nonomuraea polychroma TaxID=46176 RepID=UPI003D8E623C